ncbi:hypothetical protein [Halorussus lipolyticus]|uniref:hypothetical protein n=1 Tax=Halorussus lipolyticus TaxID=3034024 RepID=UPI0023E756B1|nr:hypothetical protein [Halorussus sp. DT80]
MARDDTARDSDSASSLLDRRSYLKLAGATAATVAGAGAAASAGTAAAASADTISVSAGETRRITVSDGETFENKLIDITADNASVIITAFADDFTIRNVGIKGTHPGEENFLKVCVPSSGATGLVENVYLGDGAVPGSKGGIYVHYNPGHNGELTFRQVNMAHSSNNGLYGSAPGHRGQSGLIHVEDSYFYSNNISNVRLGSSAGTSHVRNTTIHVDDSVNGCDMNCSSPGAVNARGVWAWDGPVALHDCDVKTGSYGSALATRDGGTIAQNDSRIGSSADTSPPEAVPMTAEEAAGGSSASDSTSTDDSSTSDSSSGTLLELGSADGSSNLQYEFTVEGTVRKRTSGTDSGFVAESGDTVTDNGDGTMTVTGVAGGGYGDAFVVEGSVTSMNLDESKWTIRYGGTETTVADLTSSSDTTTTDGDSSSGDSSDSSTQLPNRLVVDGTDHPNQLARYSFTVSGDVEKAPDLGSINGFDTVDATTVEGRVVGGRDGFRFSGEITNFRLDGSAFVEVQDGS